MLVVAVTVGLAIGLLLGALGGGGSILTVPALVYLLGQEVHGATTVSLVVVGSSALTGMLAHARAGRVRVADGVLFGALGVAGSIAGSHLSAGVDPPLLLVAFAVLLLVAALSMTARTHRGEARALRRTEGRASRFWRTQGRPPPAVFALAATCVGLLTGFFGVGGGFVVVPVLVVLLGFEMPVAVGTSLLVIALNSLVSLLARLGTPVHVDWALVTLFAGAAAVGSVAGTRIASKVPARLLASAFAVLLVAVAFYTLGRSLPHVMA